MNFIEIFNAETHELVAKGLYPCKPGLSDDESQLIINSLTDREHLLEKAIEELRARKHKVIQAKEEWKNNLSVERRRLQDESDMSFKQKKQVEKIDRQVNVKKLKAQNLIEALRDVGRSEDEIKEILAAKNLL